MIPRPVLVGAARGAALGAVLYLGSVSLHLDVPHDERGLAAAAFGALAGGARVGLMGRSLVGSVCIWVAVALTALDVPAFAPHLFGDVMNQVLGWPVLFYGSVFAVAAVLGAVDLLVESGCSTPRAAARGAAIGACLGFACAVVLIGARLLARPQDFNQLAHDDFDQGLRFAVTAVPNVLIFIFAALGVLAGALSARLRVDARWQDTLRSVIGVVLLWSTFLAVLTMAVWRASISFASYSQTKTTLHALRVFLPPPAYVAAFGGVLGLLFVFAWLRLGRRDPHRPPTPFPLPTPRLLLPCTLAFAVALGSLLVQVKAARTYPVDRIARGDALVRQLYPERGQQPRDRLVFSPDGTTLWQGNRSGISAGWRVKPGGAAWRPTVDLADAFLNGFRRSALRTRIVPAPERTDVAWLEVIDATGKCLSRRSVRIPADFEPRLAESPHASLEVTGSLVVGAGATGTWVMHWPSGAWVARDVETVWTTSTRALLCARVSVGEGRPPRSRVVCLDTSSGQPVFSVENLAVENVWFYNEGRLAVIEDEYRDLRVWRVDTGAEVPSPDPWTRQARSPDGSLIATLQSDGVHLADARSGRPLATLMLTSDGACAVAPDGRVSGDLQSLGVVDGDRVMPVTSDYPLVDPTLYPALSVSPLR